MVARIGSTPVEIATILVDAGSNLWGRTRLNSQIWPCIGQIFPKLALHRPPFAMNSPILAEIGA